MARRNPSNMFDDLIVGTKGSKLGVSTMFDDLMGQAQDGVPVTDIEMYADTQKTGINWWKTLEEIAFLGYRPVGAALKMSSERVIGERPWWSTFQTSPTDYFKKVIGPLEDIQGKAITDPVAQKLMRALPKELATPLGTLFYGGLPTQLLYKDKTKYFNAYAKSLAAQGLLGDIKPEDLPEQLSPAGILNFSIEMIGLDLLIPSSWGVKLFKGAGKLAMKTVPGVEGLASLFSRHLGKGSVVNKIVDEMQRMLNATKGKIFDDEYGIAKSVGDVLKKHGVPLDEARPVIADIVETYKPVIKPLYEAPPSPFKPKAPPPTKGKILAPGNLKEVVEKALPGIKDANDVDVVAKAIQHYLDLGVKVPELERLAGLPIKQLISEDLNYLLHYVVDSVRPLLKKHFPKGATDTRLLSDIFHPSMKTRAMRMSIKEANAIAAEGRMYVKEGKVGILKSVDDPLPAGAKLIPKLFDDDVARLAFIRQVRAAEAITTKQYLDRAFDTIPDYVGPNAVTLKDVVPTARWAKTFGMLGDVAEKYANKPFDPGVAQHLMHGLHMFHNFKLVEKGRFLKVYDAILNWWKPMQLYAFQQYHTRNFGTAMWNEYMNDNFWGFLQGLFEIVSHGRLANHPLFREMKNWGGFGRSQFTADVEKFADVMTRSASMKQDIKEGALGLATIGLRGNVAKIGEFFENIIRFSSYLGWRNKGHGPQEAVRKVMFSQFDYADLTPFEWNVMRRFFPFYTFTRKNIPFQIERTLARPGKAAQALRARFTQEKEWEPGERELLAPTIGERAPVKVGKDQYLALEDTWALTDITKFFSKDALKEIVNMSAPHLKIGFELFSRTVDGRWTGWGPIGPGEMTGYSLFTKKPIKPWWKETDDVWGRPLPVKFAYFFESTFRLFRHVEKMPWYPEDEGKPIGQSKFAKFLQQWGIPFYENHPQQQIYWRVKEIEREQEEMGGMTTSTKSRYKALAIEKIWLLGKQDQMLEPFRGGKRIIQKEDAVLDELSGMTGVDMKALRGKYGDKWREEAAKAPNVFVNLEELRQRFPGYDEEEIQKEAFKILEDEAKSKVFFKGAIENYSDAITTITTLLNDDRRAKTFNRTLLNEDEEKWLQGSLIAILNKGVEYLDYNRRQGNFEWYPYSDKLKEWTEFIYARTGQMPKEIQEVQQRMVQADYDKLKAQFPKPTDERYTKLLSFARKQTNDPYLATEVKDQWWDEWTQLNIEKLNVELARKDFSSIAGQSQFANLIKDDSLPIEIRREFGKYYAIRMKALIDAGVRSKQSWQWVEDNVIPLYQ